MGCGASSAAQVLPESKPSTSASSGAAKGVEIVLVLGLDVSGISTVCASLSTAISAAGRQCSHLNVSELMKAEVSSGSELGLELSTLIQQGKIITKPLLAQLVKKAISGMRPGVCLLEGYPTSLPALTAMSEEIGHAPKLALLLELTDDQATKRYADGGVDGSIAASKISAFKMVREPQEQRQARPGQATSC